MFAQRLYRSLSAFDRAAHRWAIRLPNAVPQRPLPQHTANKEQERLTLASWNVDAFSPRPVIRAQHILDRVLAAMPDAIFFQEVTPAVRDAFLRDGRIRSGFLATDAEDTTAFESVPFATMTLLSNRRFAVDGDQQQEPAAEVRSRQPEPEKAEGGGRLTLEAVFRLPLPSRYGRDGLCVDIANPAAPGTVLRLINTHLDSLDTFSWREAQMKTLAGVLCEPGCSGGVIGGDFNAIGPEDDELVNKNGLVDVWAALGGHTGSDGATWGVVPVDGGVKPKVGMRPKRLDKIATLGLEAETMGILRPGQVEVPRPAEESLYYSWSDHCGLRCTFPIRHWNGLLDE